MLQRLSRSVSISLVIAWKKSYLRSSKSLLTLIHHQICNQIPRFATDVWQHFIPSLSWILCEVHLAPVGQIGCFLCVAHACQLRL